MESKTTTSKQMPGPARPAGRPRQFDLDTAIGAALQVFRERGYHAASLNDLSAAMDLTAGSIYKAFTGKRTIFLAAFDQYVTLRHARLNDLLEAEADGRARVRAMLVFYADSSHGAEGRLGCLVAGSATDLATYDEEMAARVVGALQRTESLLRELIRQGQADGSVSAAIDAEATASTLLCVLQGMRVIGKVGRSRKQMRASVDQALRLLG